MCALVLSTCALGIADLGGRVPVKSGAACDRATVYRTLSATVRSAAGARAFAAAFAACRDPHALGDYFVLSTRRAGEVRLASALIGALASDRATAFALHEAIALHRLTDLPMSEPVPVGARVSLETTVRTLIAARSAAAAPAIVAQGALGAPEPGIVFDLDAARDLRATQPALAQAADEAIGRIGLRAAGVARANAIVARYRPGLDARGRARTIAATALVRLACDDSLLPANSKHPLTRALAADNAARSAVFEALARLPSASRCRDNDAVRRAALAQSSSPAATAAARVAALGALGALAPAGAATFAALGRSVAANDPAVVRAAAHAAARLALDPGSRPADAAATRAFTAISRRLDARTLDGSLPPIADYAGVQTALASIVAGTPASPQPASAPAPLVLPHLPASYARFEPFAWWVLASAAAVAALGLLWRILALIFPRALGIFAAPVFEIGPTIAGRTWSLRALALVGANDLAPRVLEAWCRAHGPAIRTAFEVAIADLRIPELRTFPFDVLSASAKASRCEGLDALEPVVGARAEDAAGAGRPFCASVAGTSGAVAIATAVEVIGDLATAFGSLPVWVVRAGHFHDDQAVDAVRRALSRATRSGISTRFAQALVASRQVLAGFDVLPPAEARRGVPFAIGPHGDAAEGIDPTMIVVPRGIRAERIATVPPGDAMRAVARLLELQPSDEIDALLARTLAQGARAGNPTPARLWERYARALIEGEPLLTSAPEQALGDLRALAWLVTAGSLAPGAAPWSLARRALEGPEAGERLAALRTRLPLLVSDPDDADLFAFRYEGLARELAATHVVNAMRLDERVWDSLGDRLRKGHIDAARASRFFRTLDAHLEPAERERLSGLRRRIPWTRRSLLAALPRAEAT